MSITRKAQLVWSPELVYGKGWNNGKDTHHELDEFLDTDFINYVKTRTTYEDLELGDTLDELMDEGARRLADNTFVSSTFWIEFEGDDGEFHHPETFKKNPQKYGDLFSPNMDTGDLLSPKKEVK